MGGALDYHLATAHVRGRLSARGVDWVNRPPEHKLYPGLPGLTLPRPQGLPDLSLARALHGPAGALEPDVRTLSNLLFLAWGVTATQSGHSGEHQLRSAASAGALYPTEIYVALESWPGLEDGLYHYRSSGHCLARLRQGRVLGDRGFGARFFLSSIFLRSAWKYGERAFRYCLLDAGHVAENLKLAAAAMGLNLDLETEFNDQQVNAFLGLDPGIEGCLAVLGSAKDLARPLPAAGPEAVAGHETGRTSDPGHGMEVILAAYRSGCGPGPGPDQDLAWPGPEDAPRTGLPETKGPDAPLGETVVKRRSRREFSDRPLDLSELAGLARVLDQGPNPQLRAGFALGRVQGLDAGFYLLDPEAKGLSLHRPGLILSSMAQVCLDQSWLSRAALHVLYLIDLARLDAAGPRAYRRAMIQMGRLGQRTYLAATALGLGCCGVGSIYDREAQRLLRLPESVYLPYINAVGPVA